uniref:MMGP7 n=1 Tax=uncultured organism TaxID=155900 RepID=G9HQ38_9ZZZZ|nr:MMGP7 [uncultured organism]
MVILSHRICVRYVTISSGVSILRKPLSMAISSESTCFAVFHLT